MDRKYGILPLRPFKRTRDSEDSTNKRPPTKTSITVNNPREGNQLQGGDKMRVKWTCQGHVPNVDILLRKGNHFLWSISLASGVANEGTYSVTVPKGLLPSSDYTVEVKSAGNQLQGGDKMRVKWTHKGHVSNVHILLRRGRRYESNMPEDSCADVEFAGEKSFDEVQQENLERAKRNGDFLDLDADDNASFESNKCIINLMNDDDNESDKNFDSAAAGPSSQRATWHRQRCMAPFVPPLAL
ncbi:hypothetical protein CYMTET_49511 [Cymbomonas tetramitiformis]|uniref:Yeast cell wall synthesis Kre9/Knh1-like N-terminal domain-containing protein n=1 Tax=Cymbomonas tetramitiformis TaxID=36881 RepID=A0AAE0BQ29_9CHLO|nr:hypothetical protein CYMTET_49511 [Cymbomonas tetramitiformis]